MSPAIFIAEDNAQAEICRNRRLYLTTRRAKIGEQSKAITSIQKDTCGSPVASPSRLRANSISSDSITSAGGASINDDDDDNAFLQLLRLQTGQGLDSEQWLSVSAQCPECEHYYRQGKFFKKHMEMCLGILDMSRRHLHVPFLES